MSPSTVSAWDDLADNRHIHRLLFAFVQNGDRDRLARLAPQQASDVGHRHAFSASIVDSHDSIAGADACLIGGRVQERTKDRQLLGVWVDRDFHADAAELLVNRFVELASGRPA